VEETSSGMAGPMLRRLREAMINVPERIRKAVSLLVKSSPDNRMTCSKFISEGGFHTSTCNDGKLYDMFPRTIAGFWQL
jgi:hypothetical protein